MSVNLNLIGKRVQILPSDAVCHHYFGLEGIVAWGGEAEVLKRNPNKSNDVEPTGKLIQNYFISQLKFPSNMSHIAHNGDLYYIANMSIKDLPTELKDMYLKGISLHDHEFQVIEEDNNV